MSGLIGLSENDVKAAVHLIARAVLADQVVREHLTRRIANELMPRSMEEPDATRRAGDLFKLAQALCAPIINELCDAATAEVSSMLDANRAMEIRQFFLSPQPTYSLSELAELWRIPMDDVLDVCDDEIDAALENSDELSGGFQLSWEAAASLTRRFSLIRHWDIENALGDDFERVRSKGWRTHPVIVRLPLFIADAFKLDPAIPTTLALAERVEHLLTQIFRDEGEERYIAN